MIEIGAALAGLKGAWELAQVAVNARDDAKAKAAISDMASRFMDAQNSVIALGQTVLELQTKLASAHQKIEQLDRRLAEREQYALHELAPGNFVYRFQAVGEAGLQGAIPTHYLCQPCFDNGVKSVLSRIESSYVGLQQVCPSCKHEITCDGVG